MTDFFNMGGYAVYVWSAYGVAGVVLTWLATSAVRSLRANQSILADLEARVSRRRGRDGSQ